MDSLLETDMKKTSYYLLFQRIAFVFVLAASLFLQGCSNSGDQATLIVEPITKPKQSGGVFICSTQPSNEVPDDIKKQFDSVLREKLYKIAGVKEGPEIVIDYRLIQVDLGNGFQRFFFRGMPGKLGEGSLTTEVTYLDGNRNVIGKIKTKGKTAEVVTLFDLGLFSDAIDGAAEQIIQFTLQNFRPEIIQKKN